MIKSPTPVSHALRAQFFAASLGLFMAMLPISVAATDRPDAARFVEDLSGAGWKLWRDQAAAWEHDELFLPPANLAKIPVRPPSGGWKSLGDGIPVNVPGTTEEYLGQGLASRVTGVAWWTRRVRIPSHAAGRVVRLLFDSVSLRAEVYVDRRLAAYDLVGDTPFEADLTGLVKPGTEVELAVRVTNPGVGTEGKDSFAWGKYRIPAGNGFGGITGGVRLVVTDPVYLDDVCVQNTPKKSVANVLATVRSTTSSQATRAVSVTVREKSTGRTVLQKKLGDVPVKPGENQVACEVSAPQADLWDSWAPSLYEAEVRLRDERGCIDRFTRVFGFRWFGPEPSGEDVLLRLNGRRLFLKGAASRGLWPINGVFPLPELARKQVRIAKDFGLNMLNFPNGLASQAVLDEADSMGLLAFEGPGGTAIGQKDPFARALARERLFRMIKRDRSHPCLIIYVADNGGLEKAATKMDSELLAIRRADLQAAHALDPSRTLFSPTARVGCDPTIESGDATLHMRPFDETVFADGWLGYRRPAGPEEGGQGFSHPGTRSGQIASRAEIICWGEGRGTPSPPRLGLIRAALAGAKRLGWDGQTYLDWYRAANDFLTANQLRKPFPTVDELCQAMGAASLEDQGRKIEEARICDPLDGYEIAAWESGPGEDPSGIVDIFRNPKADPGILARYNEPLTIAVHPRRQNGEPGERIPVDFFLLNEKGLEGNFTIEVVATDPEGREKFHVSQPAHAVGGDVFSAQICDGLEIPLLAGDGVVSVSVRLLGPGGDVLATGHCDLLTVGWKNLPLAGQGAVLEEGGRVREFLKDRLGLNVPAFDGTQPRLDWLVVAQNATPDPSLIEADFFRGPDGKSRGLKATFYSEKDLGKALVSRTDAKLDFRAADGEPPDSHARLSGRYVAKWQGVLVPPASGEYTVALAHSNGARLWLGGKLVSEQWRAGSLRTDTAKVNLEAGKGIAVRVELLQSSGEATARLMWLPPPPQKISPAQVLARAKADGTTVLIVDRAESWLEAIAQETASPPANPFPVGIGPAGGQFFVKEHPLFDGLPVNQALGWPYRSVLSGNRTGLDGLGGELVAGACQTQPFRLGAAVSVVPLGRGRVVVSTLDIAPQLANPDPSADVARRLLCNFLRFAATRQTSE